VFQRKLIGKKPLGRYRSRCEEDIKMEDKGIRWERVDLINLAHDRDKWRAFVYTVM
jgi:hypothetical protein